MTAAAQRSADLRNYVLVTAAYWADTIADGAIRLLVLFFFYERGYTPIEVASLSLIPTTTGSATAIGLIFPELQGKLDGLAVRVPLLNASLTDAVFEVARPTTVDEVNALLRAAADGPLAGILGYEDRPLVSVDYKDDPRSGIVDALSTMVTDSTQVKVLAWYDNEWGYANRLTELARTVGESL